MGMTRGYICENYGAAFQLPALGPIGANGLANARDFQAPVGAYEDREGTFQLLDKFGDNLWAERIDIRHWMWWLGMATMRRTNTI